MSGKHNTPFQMKGTPFQRNFGISPVKTAVLGSAMGNKKSGKLRDKVVKKFIDKPLQNMNTNDPDRPGSNGMYPTGFETKIPRINKLKKI